MKKLVSIILTLSLFSPLFAQSKLSSIRCGGKIVRNGDTKAHVISACGKPQSDDVIAEDRSGIKITESVYNVSGKLKIITFRANKVTSIKDV